MSENCTPERDVCKPTQCSDLADAEAHAAHVQAMDLAWKYDCKIEREMQQIVPHLFLGSVKSAWNEDLLVENNVQDVFTIMTNELYHRESTYFQHSNPPEQAGFQPKTMKSHHIKYAYLKLDDEETDYLDKDMFETWTRYMHERIQAKQNILVHCQAGISRSVTFVIAYLIRYHGMTRNDALQNVRQLRCIAYPNDGYYAKLLEFETHVKQSQHTKLLK